MTQFESTPTPSSSRPYRLDTYAELQKRAARNGEMTDDEAVDFGLYKKWGRNSVGFNLEQKKLAGTITQEEEAELAGWNEFKNPFSDNIERQLVQREALGTLTESQKESLEIARHVKKEGRDYTDEEMDKVWVSLDIS
ncbi:MAG: hypothetical protein RDU25_03120 [Patescibacteria group bacterium]|nr:hypothetical protein [Patescibacteria group bacterium]